MKTSLALTLTLALLAATAHAKCPSDCSGKGRCGADDLCTCYPGYTGRDCSERTCQYGRSWADTPYGRRFGADAQNSEKTGAAHQYAECSDAGICDRKTGECQCNDGFSGDGCRYSACPNDCSGHGTCEFSSELATEGQVFEVSSRTPTHLRSTNDRSYGVWDQHSTRACVCDPYWHGNDCSLRMCPKGDDPLTKSVKNKIGANAEQRNEIQTVTITAANSFFDNKGEYVGLGGTFTLTYTDAYGQEWTTRPIRVKTQLSGDTLTVDAASDKVKDSNSRLALFDKHDVVGFESPVANGLLNRNFVVKTSTEGSEIEVVGDVTSSITSSANNKVFLANQNTGEIGVKRALQELPNQVIPSITVDETITDVSNTYRITFSDAANAGDQQLLKCRVDACTTDGCQPRTAGLKGLFQVAGTGISSQVISAATGHLTHYSGSTFYLGGLTAASENGKESASAFTANTITASGLTDDNSAFVINWVQSFVGDDYGLSAAHVIQFKSADRVEAGNKVPVTSSAGFTVGDTVYVYHDGGSTKSGVYSIIAKDSTTITLDRAIAADSSDVDIVVKKIQASPCVVEETTKGSTELLECSGRGLCDESVGECACFEGYTGEACSQQTVLI
jgi:hypothetical protein